MTASDDFGMDCYVCLMNRTHDAIILLLEVREIVGWTVACFRMTLGDDCER